MNRNLPLYTQRFGGPAAAFFLTAFFLIALMQSAHAGGVRDIPLTSIPLARSPIVIDGSLSEWPDTHPITIVPVDPGLVKSGSTALDQIRRRQDSAALQTSYDSKKLYFGILWKGPASARSDHSVTFHIKTDRIVHIRFVSLATGRQGSLQERLEGEPKWRPINADGAKCVTARHANGTATQEIGIPWVSLTKSGTAATGFTLAADFEWPGLTPSFLRQLPTTVLHANTHLTACFLTSSEKLFGRDAYLGSPIDWGVLKFVDQPHSNATRVSTLATGATETYVPKAQTPLVINGNLSGWKPAQFQSVVSAPGFLGDRYSAKIALAYDAGFLYVAARVRSLGGPLNTQPEVTQAGYAGGDCFQVRLSDGRHTINLCAWYDSARRKPALTADGSDLKDPYLLKQGAKEAFRIDPKGQGYTQEFAIPWAVLPTGAVPKADDTWKGTFQVWWSGLNSQFTAVAGPTLAQGGSMAYSYLLPKESNVTLGIYDAQGRLIRTLIKDVRRRSGRNTEYWDGKDQFGRAVTAGKYQVRGIEHPPIGVQPILSLGNPGTPPWPTADGQGDWLSDESAPQAAVTDGRLVYLASPGSEKGHSIIAVGPDGRRIWGYNEAVNPRCVSLAVAGQYLYALFSGPETVHASEATQGQDKIGRAFVLCLDKKTGMPALFSTQKTDFRVAAWPYMDRVSGLWDLRVNKTFTPASYEGQTRYFANDIGEPTEAVGIAAVGDRLYVSMLTQNRILVLSAITGQQIDTIPAAQPVGLHALTSGKILGISQGKIVTIDPASKSVTTTIDHDLAAPHDVTTDRAGNLYVSDWGSSFQVKVFSPQGKLLRAIGTEGGRPWIGPWDANGMLLPRGIAVTDDGKLWVAEDDASPSRISVWNAATGGFIRDYIGPTPYGGGGHFWADPNDVSTVVAEGTLFHVDYARKTWTPVSTPYRRLSLMEAFTPNGMNGMPGTRTLTHAGKQYVYVSNGSYTLNVFRRDGLLLKPVAAVGSLGRGITTDGTTLNVWDSDIGTHTIAHYYPEFFRGHNGDNYVWTDKNGDGQVQPDEMQWGHSLSRGDTYTAAGLPEIEAAWGFGVGPDGALYLGGETKDRTVVSRLDVQGWSPDAFPMYSLTAARPIVADASAGGVHGIYADDNNHVLVTRGYEWNPGKHHALDCYDREGKLLWSINAPEGRQQADDFLADNIVGEFKEPGGESILASWLWHGNFKPYLLTSDGLYISSLLDDTKLGPTATWDESYKNFFQGPDGMAYLVNGANDAYHIGKITGLDHLHRFSGSIFVSQADLTAAARTSAQTVAAPAPLPPPILHVLSRTIPPVIDGSLGDWNMSGSVALRGDKGRSARVALGRDQANLYLAYEVHGAKMVNKGGNWQTLFLSGDCVDFMLHAGPYHPHFAPAAGDERLLLSVSQGQPIAVLYRPVVPGTTASTRLMAATIDQIVKLASARIAYQRSGDGYTLEAAVPLSDLGIEPGETDTLRGDVGVVYADETGANRALRLYYYNHDTSMTADLTTEATLQPGNWGDIEFPLGTNLLKNGDFEEPLAATPEEGWAVSTARSGGAAAVEDSAAYSGSHSLVFQQTTPVSYTADSYSLPDYGAFINSANAGKGGGYAEVSQRVPVTGGKKYALRFHIHTVDFPGGENKNPGLNRGYVSLQSWVRWEGAEGGVWVVNHQDTIPAWAALKNARFNTYGVPIPYTAPPGAKFALIQFSLADNFAHRLPKAYVDDVEFAQAP